MCKCTPNMRTPFCGKGDCVWPKSERQKEVLKVLVGSQAHGLANENSDYDYRAVFVEPTSEILKLGGSVKTTNWIEGKEDNTSWEIAHFLNMAVHCNPTILEVFLAPRIIPLGNVVTKEMVFGSHLQELFPHVWNSKAVMDAFVGYGLNQRKKYLDEKDGRPAKFSVAYLRTLYQAHELLTTGTFTIRISDTRVGETLKRWKSGDCPPGEVIQLCVDWEKQVRLDYQNNPDKKTNIEPINEFLLKARKEYWNE